LHPDGRFTRRGRALPGPDAPALAPSSCDDPDPHPLCRLRLGEAEKIFNRKDSSYIVIDEIAGQQFALFLVPPEVLYIALGFLLFRLFDIMKPPPAGFCQDHLPGGWGVVMDDVAAGIWTNIILLLAIRFLGI